MRKSPSFGSGGLLIAITDSHHDLKMEVIIVLYNPPGECEQHSTSAPTLGIARIFSCLIASGEAVVDTRMPATARRGSV